MWTPKAFHVREIPANNIIHMTESLVCQNTSLFFSTYFPVKFCHRLHFSIKKNQIRELGISQQSTYMQVYVHILLFLNEKYVKIRLLMFMQVCRK